MKTLHFAVIGYGCRGRSLTKNILCNMPDVEIVAVCDEYADRAEAAADMVESKKGNRPFFSTNYMEVLNHPGVEAVLVATAWETHVEIAIDALEKGIPVALEVGGAYSLESLWNLVRMQERTGTPLMLMENCCFGKHELLVTSMTRRGVFGEVVHCHGAYGHYLAKEIAGGEQNRHYRLRNYLNRNCENFEHQPRKPYAFPGFGRLQVGWHGGLHRQ